MNKSDFLFFAQKVIDDKVIKAKEYMNSIERSIQGESKSTAGDKHDTTRELMQQERNKAAQNLSNQILDQKTLIQLLNTSTNEGIGFGSLVETDKGWIFIGLALGKVLFSDVHVICISPLSPLAKGFEGLKVGESCRFNPAAKCWISRANQKTI